MPGSHSMRWLVFFVCGALAALGCSTDTQQGESGGSLSLNLTLGIYKIDEVHWEITGGDKGGYEKSGDIDTTYSGNNGGSCDEPGDERTCILLFEKAGIPEDTNYMLTITAISTDEVLTCEGKHIFDIVANEHTEIHVAVNCTKPRETGSVWVDGWFNICAQLEWALISPGEVEVGHDITLESEASDVDGKPSDIRYLWESKTGIGTIADPSSDDTTYTCNEVGDDEINLTVSDDDFIFCQSQLIKPFTVKCVPGEIECIESGDCKDGNQCTINVCADGRCVDSDNDPGDDCDQDGGSMCDGDGNCVQCNNELDCGEDETCADGWCVLAPDCTDDIDCADLNQCTINLCAEGTCVDTDSAPGAGCEDGGVCDGQGTCVECNEDTDCGPIENCVNNMCVAAPECTMDADCPQDDPCVVNTCAMSGMCEGAPAADDTPCDAQGTPGSCQMGICEPLCSSVTCPDNGMDCITDACNPANGLCEPGDDPVDTPCDGGTCDGMGTCVPSLTCPPDPVLGGTALTACRNSFNQALSEFPVNMDIALDDCAIDGQPFNATATPTLNFDQAFLQVAVDTLCVLGILLTEADITVAQVRVDALAGATCTSALSGPIAGVFPLNITVTGTCPSGTSPGTVNAPLPILLPTVAVGCTAGAAPGPVAFCATGTTPANAVAGATAVDTWAAVSIGFPVDVSFQCGAGVVSPDTPCTSDTDCTLVGNEGTMSTCDLATMLCTDVPLDLDPTTDCITFPVEP